MNYEQIQLKKAYIIASNKVDSIYFAHECLSKQKTRFVLDYKYLIKVAIFKRTIKRRVLKHYRENCNLDINPKKMIDETDLSFYYREASTKYAKRKGRLDRKRYGTNGYNKIIK